MMALIEPGGQISQQIWCTKNEDQALRLEIGAAGARMLRIAEIFFENIFSSFSQLSIAFEKEWTLSSIEN